MSRELCRICDGGREVMTMDGFETCPSCGGRGFEVLKVISSQKSGEALRIAKQAIENAFKRSVSK